MPIPLELSYRHMRPSSFVEDAVRQHLQRIENLCSRATGCHVIVDAPHSHQRKGRLMQVHIELRLPGEPLVVSEHIGKSESHEQMSVAISDGFRALERQLERWRDKPRNERRSPAAQAARSKAFDDMPAANDGDLDAART